MPISKKIEEQIQKLDIDNDLKELMMNVLKEEDKGTHAFKQLYNKMVDEYLKKKEEENNDLY